MKRLLMLVLIAGAMLAMTTTAEATPPVRETLEVDQTGFDPQASAICGIPIETSTTGTVDTTFFLDDEGTLVRVLQRLDLAQTFTNLETGAIIMAPNVGATVHVVIGGAPDGRNLVRLTGLEGQIIVPGVGSVVQDAGQTLLAGLPGTIPTVLAQNGHFEGNGGPFPGGCQYLQ